MRPVAPVTRTPWITSRSVALAPPAVIEITGVSAAADVTIVFVAGSLPLPEPTIFTRLLTVTFSV